MHIGHAGRFYSGLVRPVIRLRRGLRKEASRGDQARPGEGKPMETSEHEIQIQDRLIRYLEAGSGPPVVLVHGNEDSACDWQWVLPGLASRYRVLAPDLPGFGDRDRSLGDYSSTGMMGFLGAFLDALGLPSAALRRLAGGPRRARLCAGEPGAGHCPGARRWRRARADDRAELPRADAARRGRDPVAPGHVPPYMAPAHDGEDRCLLRLSLPGPVRLDHRPDSPGDVPRILLELAGGRGRKSASGASGLSTPTGSRS